MTNFSTEQWASTAFALFIVIAERGDDLSTEQIKKFAEQIIDKAPPLVALDGAFKIIDIVTTSKETAK